MNSMINDLLRDIPIPQVVRVRQKFDSTALENPVATLEEELKKPGALESIRAGQRVAICVGSRGVANIAAFILATVKVIEGCGARPFIVPCMGSHGGATPEGQEEVLAHLGITGQTMGAPIISSLEVTRIGELPNGLPVYVDKNVMNADAVVVINRIKPHTCFRGPVESGLTKMIVIGLGKQRGAESCHQLGFKDMAENIVRMARIILNKVPIIFGIGLVENAYDKTCLIEVLPAETIEKREPELLQIAKSRMPSLLFNQIDVLVVDYIGKNISGDGLDPNITGRQVTPYAYGGPEVTKMVALRLTRESGGNANGVGTVDYTTQCLVDDMDRDITYANGLTSTVCSPTKIATILPNDLYAIRAAVKTCNILHYENCRLVRIKDTLHLGELEISLPMLEEARKKAEIEVLTDPYALEFDSFGNLVDP